MIADFHIKFVAWKVGKTNAEIEWIVPVLVSRKQFTSTHNVNVSSLGNAVVNILIVQFFNSFNRGYLK